MTVDVQATVDGVVVDRDVFERFPDYVVTLVAARNIVPGPSNDVSEALLVAAESAVQKRLASEPLEEWPEVQAWRAAYLAFGVKPRDGRSSVEALVRRIDGGMPRIDRLTDMYNALSVMHAMPIGGEDLAHYAGSAHLVIATGDETFDTVADGQPTVTTPSPGEVIWRDDLGVTCRRWNWRQCVRTRLTHSTTDALFIIDGIGADARERGELVARKIIEHLSTGSADAQFALSHIENLKQSHSSDT
jgi:DNA/RNA-binding domain of Phe-tRNA-synthetase-like protein